MKNLIDQKLNDVQICYFIIIFLYFLPFLTKQMRIGKVSLLDFVVVSLLSFYEYVRGK